MNIRSAIWLAVPTHMALFFIFGCTQWKEEEREKEVERMNEGGESIRNTETR